MMVHVKDILKNYRLKLKLFIENLKTDLLIRNNQTEMDLVWLEAVKRNIKIKEDPLLLERARNLKEKSYELSSKKSKLRLIAQ